MNTEPEQSQAKPQRFMVRSFSDPEDCEAFLNLLDDDQIVAAFAESRDYITVCVERIPSGRAIHAEQPR